MQDAEAAQVRMAFDRGYVARQEIQRPGFSLSPLELNLVSGDQRIAFTDRKRESSREISDR